MEFCNPSVYECHTEMYTKELADSDYTLTVKYIHGVKIVMAKKDTLSFEYIEIPEFTGIFETDVKTWSNLNKVAKGIEKS
jgi:hypothetical protein